MTPIPAPLLGTQRADASSLLHRVRVARRERLSDGFVRITFTGPTLDRFADPGLDQRMKLILPAPGGSLDDMPVQDGWYAAWRQLPTARRPIIRTYTTRAVRRDAREVDVDLVLHEPCGPAGRFARDCAEGDVAVLCGPNRGAAVYGGGIDFRMPPTPGRVLVAGDETALPAIVRIVEALPPTTTGAVLVELPSAADGALLPTHPGVTVRVLAREGAPSGSLLRVAVREAAEGLLAVAPGEEPEDVDVDAGLLWEVPEPGDGAFSAWLAGEAGTIKAIRRVLVAELGVDRRSVSFMGYWRTGRPEAV